ncbi:MAG: hypothetical protein O3A51_02285 [Verrucomicrobia bacterium]|nr:hypothetical protein [Verrucomicrobiota bacterium]
MIKKQFTVYLEHKPGALAKVLERLADAKIDIEGLSAYSSTDVGLVQIVSSNAARTRAVLKEAKLAFTSQDVVVVPIACESGSLAAVVCRMAKAGININYLYVTGCEAKGNAHTFAVIGADNMKKANAFRVNGS